MHSYEALKYSTTYAAPPSRSAPAAGRLSCYLQDNRPVQRKQASVYLVDNRPSSVVQRKQAEFISNVNTTAPVQRRSNTTGLPDNLRSGIESLSGYSMDDVKVHYNSSQPAQLNAHAYAQGTDIHIASGQEKHLAHEAWHVVQQKQGRVKPTMQMKGKVNDGIRNEEETGVVQGMWQKQPLHDDPEELPVWEESVQGYIYDPDTAEWSWGDEDEFETPEDAERAHIPYKLALLGQMSTEEERMYYEDHPDDKELIDVSRDIQRGSLEAAPVSASSHDSVAIDIDALQAMPPAKPGEDGSYRVYGTNSDAGWKIVHLKRENDRLVSQDGGTFYKVVNRPFGKGLPFVSEDAGTENVQPTAELVHFLSTYGYDPLSGGRIQDRIHHAVVNALLNKKQRELSDLFKIPVNAKWYTNNIRQGGLNELILTSQSVSAVNRGVEDHAFDPIGWRDGKPYSFVQLQRDTSYPTKDFVFKTVFDIDGKKYQNSHVNARMYRVDGAGKKHQTVGPVSPQYHLAVNTNSLQSLFDRSHSMKALVGRLIELHKYFLATKSDILSVPAAARGDQVYEMRGGYPLKLDNDANLKLFASIVNDHTISVLNNLKELYSELEDVPDRAPPSPHNMPSPMQDQPPQSPSSPV